MFENLIKKVATSKSWGNDLIMKALSIVIKRPIFYYNTLGNTVKTTQNLIVYSHSAIKNYNKLQTKKFHHFK